jgi:hypothetical protein
MRLLISVFIPSAEKGCRKSREENHGSIRKPLSAISKSIDCFSKSFRKGFY